MKNYDYSSLSLTELIDKIDISRFFHLPKMVAEALRKLDSKPSSGYSKPYKVYTALLSQSGTDAPVPTVLENTLGDVVWSRNGVGVYQATLNGSFLENKTFVSFGANKTARQAGDLMQIYDDEGFSDDDIKIAQILYDTTLVDNFTKIGVEIRVYN